MAWDKLTLVTKTLPWFLPYLLRASIHRISALFHKYSYKPTENAQQVVVIGGSFAGLQLVRHLTESLPTGYKVVWIEKNSHLNFVFAFPRFSVVSGYEERAFIPYECVENAAPKGILARIQDRVVEVCDGCVKLASGETVEYAYLAIATGATRALPGQVVATERADGAEELRGVQGAVKESKRIAVVGAGAVGVELAADIKDVFPDKEVTLVHSRGGVLNRFGERLQEYTLSTLRDVLNVRVLLNERPKLPGGEALVKSATLQFSDGHEEEFDLIIRCTGQTPNSSMLAPLYPTAISPSTSQILVKPTFQINTSPSDSSKPPTSISRIFAFGDVAAHPGPLMARAGFIQSETVAANILSLVKGQEATAVYTPNMFVEGSIKLTLGKKRSVIYSSDVDGTEVLIEMGGAPEDMDVGRAWHPAHIGMELKSLSSNWKKLQETLKKDVSTAPTPKRKRSDRETHNDLVKKRKTVTEAGKGGKRTSQTAHASNKRKRMSQAYPDGVGKETQSISRKSSTAAFPKDNEGRSSTVEIGKYIAVDCEMVGIGPNPDNDSALARISIVNYNGDQVYDSYVRPKEMVTDWRTHVSGITPKHMVEARSLEQVQKEVAEILDGRILVGHALRNDLDALLLSHPKRDIRDTSKHPPYRKIAGGGSPRLKILASEFLGLKIQDGAHSSVEDAKATMLLYRRDKDEFEREHLKKWPVRVAPESKENGEDEKKRKKKKKKTRKR